MRRRACSRCLRLRRRRSRRRMLTRTTKSRLVWLSMASRLLILQMCVRGKPEEEVGSERDEARASIRAYKCVLALGPGAYLSLRWQIWVD